MTQTQVSPEITTGSDFIEICREGFEVNRFIQEQDRVAGEAIERAVESVSGFIAADTIPEEERESLASGSLQAHIELAKLLNAQGRLDELQETSAQTLDRALEVRDISDGKNPIHLWYMNMQNGQMEPTAGILGLTGAFPIVQRVHPPKVKGRILSTDLSSNIMEVKPRRGTAHSIGGDIWKVSMIGEEGEPLVEVNFLD